jgi:hypothetical protein
MEQMKQQGSPGALSLPASGDIADMTNAEMAQKLIAYQQFMAKYIVEAQQQKGKAVLAAEAAVKQKYEEKLMLLSGGTEAPKPAVIEASADTKLYLERNENVSAAAKAGKSRWGDMENERAAKTAGVAVASTEAVAAAPVQVNGAVVPAILDRSLYDERNAMVKAAGFAGKSRWGDMEIQKAISVVANLPASAQAAPKVVVAPKAAASIEVIPEVAAADHGLRNDGGVGGPSLAERINFGFQLMSASAAPALAAPAAASTARSLFDQRNLMIAAAGKAGKSRWGVMELQKAEAVSAALPSAAASTPVAATSVAVAVKPEVVEADHGLRNEGSVGGPSLAERINMGAALG